MCLYFLCSLKYITKTDRAGYIPLPYYWKVPELKKLKLSKANNLEWQIPKNSSK